MIPQFTQKLVWFLGDFNFLGLWAGGSKFFASEIGISTETVLDAVPWLLAVDMLLCWLRLPTVNAYKGFLFPKLISEEQEVTFCCCGLITFFCMNHPATSKFCGLWSTMWFLPPNWKRKSKGKWHGSYRVKMASWDFCIFLKGEEVRAVIGACVAKGLLVRLIYKRCKAHQQWDWIYPSPHWASVLWGWPSHSHLCPWASRYFKC